MPRIAFYSHDTFGLGHLRRCLKLAHAIAPRLRAREGLLITGSAWAHLFRAPRDFRWLVLPSVVKKGRSYRARDGSIDLPTLLEFRRRRIERTVARFRPDLFIVDNVPCGLRGEVLPALRRLKARPGCRCVLALRDVLDEPATVEAEWSEAGADEALETLYDEVWVFGTDRDVDRLRVLSSVPAGKVVACGRLPAAPSHAPRVAPPERTVGGDVNRTRPKILVTGGGGGDAQRLVSTYVEVLRTRQPPLASRVVLGPDFPQARFQAIARRNGFAARIERFVPDLPMAMAEADLVVAMAGYNTVCEIESAGRRSILVPRVWPRREQWIRAREQQRRGRALILPPDRLAPGSLWQAIEQALAQPTPTQPAHSGDATAARRAGALLGCAASEV